MVALTRKKFYPSLIISEEKIQVIRLDETGTKFSRLAEERLAEHVIVGGEVKDQASLAASLRNLFQAAKISEKFVVVGIPENKCYTKVLDLPKLKLDELSEAVSWEADTYLPVDSDKVYMDWKIVRENQGGVITILLIAAPKEMIEGYTLALKAAGLTPVAFETTALSLVRLIEKEQARSLIILVQKMHAVLTLSRGKAIEASSIVAFTDDEPDKKIHSLTQTIGKMLTYYEEKKGQEKIEKIYICGEGASEDVRSTIEKETGRQVAFAPIPIANPPRGREQSFTVASALARKEIRAPSDQYTVNLLPPEIQKEFDSVREKKNWKFLLTVSTGITISAAAASIIALLLLRNVGATLAGDKLKLTPLPSEIGKAIAETQRVNRAANVITRISQKRVFPQSKIAEILNTLPQGVQIVLINLDENQKKLTITGRAVTRDDMLRFRDQLDDSPAFTQAVLPLSSLQRSENVEFTLTAVMR